VAAFGYPDGRSLVEATAGAPRRMPLENEEASEELPDALRPP
jgi:hypothetical protein